MENIFQRNETTSETTQKQSSLSQIIDYARSISIEHTKKIKKTRNNTDKIMLGAKNNRKIRALKKEEKNLVKLQRPFLMQEYQEIT